MDGIGETEIEAVRKLGEAAMGGNVASLTQLLHDHPLLLHRIIVDHSDSETPLHVAAMLGHIDFVREILSQNSELALELDSKRRSPLHLASAKGYVDIVKLLLQKVDEPKRICKLKDEFGRTPLHVAAMKGRNEVIKELLHHVNAEAIRILTHQGETILHLAVKHNRLDTLKLLLVGDKVSHELLNCKDADGNTILHLAVANRQTETVRYLLGGEIDGMEINGCNKNSSTPLDVLLQSPSDWRDREIVEFFRDKGAVRGPNHTPSTVPKDRVTRSKRKNHQSDDWTDTMRSALMVVASLIATVAFQAGLTPPGGFWQETDHLHTAGDPIMAYNHPESYRIYYIANTMAFYCSLGIILLLISGIPLGRRVLMWVLMIIMWSAIVSLALTYTTVARARITRPSSPITPSSSPKTRSTTEAVIRQSSHRLSTTAIVMGIGIVGLVLLLVIIFLGNFLRMVKRLVCKFVVKDEMGGSASTTADGNV